MLTDEELKKKFNERKKIKGLKFKWYTIINYISSKAYTDIKPIVLKKIVADKFWSDDEKRIIKRVIYGEEVVNWTIEYRVFGCGEHLDFCIILNFKLSEGKLKRL